MGSVRSPRLEGLRAYSPMRLVETVIVGLALAALVTFVVLYLAKAHVLVIF
jgi:hypothetical protein